MSQSPDDTVVKWSNLRVFKVESTTGNPQLYANGRQQVELLVKIQVSDTNGDVVPLSDAEANSLNLISYDHDTNIPREFFSTQPIPANTWRWSYHHNYDYRFMPGTGGFSPRSLSERSDSLETLRKVYLRTTSLTPLKLALEITRDDGRVFRSKNPDLENGAITATPLTARSYQARDYSFKRIVVKGDPDSLSEHDGHDMYPLELHENGEHVHFSPYSFTVLQGNIYRFDIAPRTRGSYTAVAAPGNSYLLYQDLNLNNPVIEVDARYIKTGTIVVALIRRNRVMLYGPPPHNDDEMAFSAVDVYGNNHNFRIRFQGVERKVLELV